MAIRRGKCYTEPKVEGSQRQRLTIHAPYRKISVNHSDTLLCHHGAVSCPYIISRKDTLSWQRSKLTPYPALWSCFPRRRPRWSALWRCCARPTASMALPRSTRPSSKRATCCSPRAAARRKSRSTASRRATAIWPCASI